MNLKNALALIAILGTVWGVAYRMAVIIGMT